MVYMQYDGLSPYGSFNVGCQSSLYPDDPDTGNKCDTPQHPQPIHKSPTTPDTEKAIFIYTFGLASGIAPRGSFSFQVFHHILFRFHHHLGLFDVIISFHMPISQFQLRLTVQIGEICPPPKF